MGTGAAPADRAIGILLFLPVPVVLWLFTRAPLGVGPSILLGVVLMLTHRLYARPWALARSARRCLWCAGPAAGPLVQVAEPPGETTWRTCGEPHRERLGRTLGWVARWRLFVLAGIGGAILALVLGGPLAARGWLGSLGFSDVSAFFRLAVAVTVLPLSLVGPFSRAPGAGVPRLPFPVHIQALIGTLAVLWLFRIVGVIWLVQGLGHFVGRGLS